MATEDMEVESRSSAEAMEVDTEVDMASEEGMDCLLYTSPSPRDKRQSRMPSSA